MKKKYVLVLTFVLMMGMTACSFNQKEGATVTENIVGSENEKEKTTGIETKTMEATTSESVKTESSKAKPGGNNGEEYSSDEETVVADPIPGIVEKYADNTIMIKNPDDDMLYYFSTKNAQIVEGNSPIAVGDIVEITYQGLLGDGEHPGEAVKIVAIENK